MAGPEDLLGGLLGDLLGGRGSDGDILEQLASIGAKKFDHGFCRKCRQPVVVPHYCVGSYPCNIDCVPCQATR